MSRLCCLMPCLSCFLTVSSYWYQQVISVKNRATLIVAVL
ncbi:hypothetical protein PROVRETT_08794 [Providencia rettgeri DSM 1131]|nr:hypothetical protein PROVRETT_08794 [Providencia rettgeri DSM 1131]